MKVSALLVLLCLVPFKQCLCIEFPGNPFSFFRKFYAQPNKKASSKTISSNEVDGTSSNTGDADGKGGNEFMSNLRDDLIRSNVNINSRDEIVSSAINLVSNIGTAAVYAFLVRSIIRSVSTLMSEFHNMSSNLNNVGNTTIGTAFEKKFIKENVTLNSFELEVLSSSIIEPSSSQIEVDFDDIVGLEDVKYGLLDCCHLLRDVVGNDVEDIEEDSEDEHSELEEEEEVVVTDFDDMDSEVLALNKTILSSSPSSPTNKKDRQNTNSLIRPVQGILLYGPPGCGKTALTRALGKKCHLPIIQFTPSTLLRKWVGETPQLLKAIMSLVIKIQPCILFIDEMDGLFRARTQDDNTVDRQIKTEFMQLWDDIFRDPSNQVMVIGASNRPQDLDAAIQRRFERSYLVGMPDERARIGIFRKLLHPVKVEDGFSYKRCSIMTAKYTPSDIVSICKAAACIPMREQQRAKREAMEAYEAEMKQMHLESGNNSMNSSRSEGKGGKIKVPLRSLTLKDIQEALQTVIPSTVVASRYVKGYNDPRGQSGHNEGTGMPPQGTSNGVINPFTGKFEYMHDDEDDGYDDYDDDDDDDDDEEEE